uniref:hypothetical protein n=1 Tax=Bacillus multifaciens TaxID=3068506 RepID=UPI003F49716B
MIKLNDSRKKKILQTKKINVGLFELSDSYGLGKKINVFCEKLNSIYTLTVFNITLGQKAHWVVHLK